jgi:hypothetical protein
MIGVDILLAAAAIIALRRFHKKHLPEILKRLEKH